MQLGSIICFLAVVRQVLLHPFKMNRTIASFLVLQGYNTIFIRKSEIKYVATTYEQYKMGQPEFL
jgi:uncharacterized protein YbgA (DUF1722 family)